MNNELLKTGNEEVIIEIIDIEIFIKEGRKPPIGHRYKIKVGDHFYIFDHHIITGQDIFDKVGVAPVECFWLYQKLRGCDFERIHLHDKINLVECEVEAFIIKPTEVFHYTVDGEPETTDEKELTPNQILEAADIIPVSDYYLVRVNADGSQDSFKNTPETPIKMLCPAVKFVSAYRGETPVS
jgi:hypothetical protein